MPTTNERKTAAADQPFGAYVANAFCGGGLDAVASSHFELSCGPVGAKAGSGEPFRKFRWNELNLCERPKLLLQERHHCHSGRPSKRGADSRADLKQSMGVTVSNSEQVPVD